MTAAELAKVFNAKKVGRGKWIAKCSAHPDRNPSLSIAVGRKVPVVLKCMSAGCDTKAILEAAGLSWASLFDGKATPEILQRMTWEEQRKALDRQLGLVIVLAAIEPEKRSYWNAAEKRIRSELTEIRWKTEPEKVWQEQRNQQVQEQIKKHGFDNLWRRYGVDGSVSGSDSSATEVRQDRIHHGGSGLQDGGDWAR